MRSPRLSVPLLSTREGRPSKSIGAGSRSEQHETTSRGSSSGWSAYALSFNREVWVASVALRVAFITQYFPPEVYPQTRWLAEALRGQGFSMRVVTSIPNYPTGEVLAGYSAWKPYFEVQDGFHVTRAPVFPSHDDRALGRIANYTSFAASSAWFGRRVLDTADVVLVWGTPATVGMPALVGRVVYGTPYVLFVQDLWPDSVFATQYLIGAKTRRLAEAGLRPFMSALYSHAGNVAGITPGMRETLIERGVPKSRASCVYNWVDEGVMRPVVPNGRLRSALNLAPDAFVMVFAGNQGSGQALDSWIAAMARLRGCEDTHLVLLGAGSMHYQLRRQVSDADLNNVHFHGQVPIEEVSSIVADADVSVLSLADEPLFHITMPSKTQAALAQGKAIISSAPGETSRTIRRAGAGWLARPADPDSIAEAISAARNAGQEERRRRGEAGRRYYMDNMSHEVGVARLAEILTTVAAEGREH